MPQVMHSAKQVWLLVCREVLENFQVQVVPRWRSVEGNMVIGKRCCQSLQTVKKQNHVIPSYFLTPLPLCCPHPSSLSLPHCQHLYISTRALTQAKAFFSTYHFTINSPSFTVLLWDSIRSPVTSPF